MTKVNLADRLAAVRDLWSPEVVAELNGQEVKIARFAGEFDWHSHANEDELFLILKGHVRIEMRERAIELSQGELFVVPRGVEHRPVADPEAEVLLFEPASTVRTGD
jgi:mannose-6-phosphate isomerase-like protein (cupin superfamily)